MNLLDLVRMSPGPHPFRRLLARPGAAVWNRLGYAMGSMQSSWDAPTGAQRAYLREAERTASEVLSELDDLYAGEVAAFRESVRAAGLTLMPQEDTPAIP